MIATFIILDDRRYPNSIKTHALNIIKVIGESLVPSSTVIAQILAGCILSIISGKSIC